jgi:hypothetical protein
MAGEECGPLAFRLSAPGRAPGGHSRQLYDNSVVPPGGTIMNSVPLRPSTGAPRKATCLPVARRETRSMLVPFNGFAQKSTFANNHPHLHKKLLR